MSTYCSEHTVGEVCADREDEETPDIEIHQCFPNLVPLDIVLLSSTVVATDTLESNFSLSRCKELGSWADGGDKQSVSTLR